MVRMFSKRARAWIGAGSVLILFMGAGLVTGEIVARDRLNARTASLGGSMPGITVDAGSGLALWQVASGAVVVNLTATEEALDALVECRTDQEDIRVRAVTGGIVVTAQRTLRGMSVPVEVLLLPQRDAAGWRLVADSVSAGGVSLPAERALRVLAGRDGGGSDLAQRLLDGIPLSLGATDVQHVAFRDGTVELTVAVPVAREDDGSGSGAGFARVRDCLGSGSSDSTDSSDQEG